MPYATGRTIHDADSHVVETPEWFEPFADPGIRDRLPRMFVGTVRPGEDRLIDDARHPHQDPDYRARDAAEIMLRKNWRATGSFIKSRQNTAGLLATRPATACQNRA